jgi:hypothetical protein
LSSFGVGDYNMRYQWAKLNRQQKGSYGEHFAKMEFAMYGFLVFSVDVDDRGIDFVARNDVGRHFDVQVKTITGKNYTYVRKSKFRPELWVTLVILKPELAPGIYLFKGEDWNADTNGLLALRKFPNAAEPEYGISITQRRLSILERYQFAEGIKRLGQ